MIFVKEFTGFCCAVSINSAPLPCVCLAYVSQIVYSKNFVKAMNSK